MKAYKGFDKNMKCRGFQYEVGKEYEEEKAELCNSGFHACTNPLDVWNYYSPCDSRFAEVEIEETSKEKCDDSKICGKKIKINAEINITKIVKVGVKIIIDNVRGFTEALQNDNGVDYANIGSSGDYAQIGSSGNYDVISAIGVNSKVKAKKGSWITLAEYDIKRKPICVKTEQVDGNKIKENTYYKLKNGEFTEVENE